MDTLRNVFFVVNDKKDVLKNFDVNDKKDFKAKVFFDVNDKKDFS